MATEPFNMMKHASEVAAWWADRGEGELPAGVLPPVGVVSLDEDWRPAAAGFAYLPIGCRVAFLDWFVARPGMRAGVTRRHLRAVLAGLESECRRFGVVHLFGSTALEAMAREAVACGFHIVSTTNTHLAKRL